MVENEQLIFKTASSALEFEQIYQLNYATFVEEIPQHPANEQHQLIDKFNDENTYFICLNEASQLIGMICVRDKRPFSLDFKIPHLDSLIPKANNICEIRLLSVKKKYRYTKVLLGLILQLYKFCQAKEYDIALISGTTRQLKLYKHLGFEIFADAVGNQEASFYPMFLTMEKCQITLQSFLQNNENEGRKIN